MTDQATIQLKNKLEELRSKRNFQLATYLKEKTKKINAFFTNAGLDAAIIGLSGGVDSALVAALLSHASLQENSNLKKIRCVIAPIQGEGTTGQDLATQKALKQAALLQQKNPVVEFQKHDLTNAYEAIIKDGKTTEVSAWTKGQMASVLRTPAFYYHAAILQEAGFRSLVVGTTNRDEGAYIGFWGKASDAMVDLQPIADLHKSEVYQLANFLAVSKEIIADAPRGDVWDGRIDEQMIGAPYWFLELYQLLLEYKEAENFSSNLSLETRILYQTYKQNIEALHRTNLHKYQVGSPAHFIDVMPRKIPNGWN